MVEIMESSFVVPSEETPRGRLKLSNLDQVALLAHTCTVYFYSNNGAEYFSIEVLKAALRKALALFYPLAGRLGVGEDGRRVVDCNFEGALFVVAQSEYSSDSINFQPSPELRSRFVPSAASAPSIMLMLQVTYLKCGGVVLGSATNHALIDGVSAFHFFQTWASIARGDLKSIVHPSFDNTPLRARSPPIIIKGTNYPEYGSDKANYCKGNTANPSSLVLTKLKLSKEQISSLKSECNKGSSTTRVSSFCVIAAFVWRCYCIAEELPPGIETRLIFTADVRKRLFPPLPEKFFGNAIMRRSATTIVSKVTSSPIHIAAEVVKAALDGITDASIRSFIDYVEEKRGEIFFPITELRDSDLRISSLCGLPAYEADFGWGAPQLMTWAQAKDNRVVYMINEPGEDGGVELFVSLDSATMQKFEKAFYELCF